MTTTKSPFFIARCDPQLHAACQCEFARLGTTQTKVINMLMQGWLDAPKPPLPVDPARLVGKPRRRKDIWLNESLLEEVEKRAAADGLPVATWIASLIQSALMAFPVVLEKEQRALERQIRELSAVGRNLNQIAHHMNSDFLMGLPIDAAELRLEFLKEIQSNIRKMHEELYALIRARCGVWGLSDGRQ